jgi:3-deoxy-D-manno-octulosonic-acid transferase
VGEVRLAIRLIERIRAQRPGLPVVLTTTTVSSQQIARDAVETSVMVTYFPFDLSWMMRRFLDTAQPRAIAVLETEIWPNLLRLSSQRGIPVLIVNGRISDKAYPIYRGWNRALRPVFGRITRCLTQSAEHAARFTALGVSTDRVRVTGNMKFDLEAPTQTELIRQVMTAFRGNSQAVFLAASTHAGEEGEILKAFVGIRTQVPGAKLVLAPRHLERLPEVEESIRQTGLKCAKISPSSHTDAESSVLVVDAWGILNQLYALADVVFIGGSLVPAGGHNLAEAAVAGRPILYGPWMQNFKDMEQEFSKANAGIKVRDAAELERRVVELFKDEAMRRSFAERSRAVVAQNAGATDTNAEEILKCFTKK